MEAAARAEAKAAKGDAGVALEDDSNEETDPNKYYENRVKAVRVVRRVGVTCRLECIAACGAWS